MRIGTGKKNAATGNLEFVVKIPFLGSEAVLLVRQEKKAESSPDYAIEIGGMRVGAVWRRTPRGGGEAFLSGPMESPVFPGGKIEIAIFASKDEDRKGEMDVLWSPPREFRGAADPAGDGEGEQPF